MSDFHDPVRSLFALRRRMTQSRRRQEEEAAYEELARDALLHEAALLDWLRDDAIDREAAGRGYRRKKPRERIWEALLQRPSAERIARMAFLLEDPDECVRGQFAAALAETRQEHALPLVFRVLLEDEDEDARDWASYGLRDAVQEGVSAEAARRIVDAVLERARRHPEDEVGVAQEILEAAAPERIAELEVLTAPPPLDENQPYFRLRESTAPWGDYGHVLAQGISWNLPRTAEGHLQLERTGPFVPPISFPDSAGALVVTEEMRRRLENSGLRGLRFAPVAKARIVLLRWEEWDAEEEDPEKYPAGSEPEHYVLRRKHRPAVADQMPALYELFPTPLPEDEKDRARLLGGSEAPDFLREPDGVWPEVVSRRAMLWLREKVGDWVRFESLPWGEDRRSAPENDPSRESSR